MSEDEKLELEYLRHFYENADFGPADGDVRAMIQEAFMSDGSALPSGYYNHVTGEDE